MSEAVDRRVSEPTTRRIADNSVRWSLGVFLTALSGMLVIYHQLWADPAGRTLGSRGRANDPMQMMWFLKWVPWAIAHGRDPLTTDAIFYPHGIELTWNTFAPTLGLLAAPLTLLAGAAVSFAVLITLGPALTALTSFWWLRRHTTRPAAAALGAAMIAFSPYMAGHMLGHLNLVFLPLLPLILMLLEDLLWRNPRPPARTAAYLALASAAQLGISEELLLITGVGVIVVLLVAALALPHQTLQAVRGAVRPVSVAFAGFILLAAPILVSQLVLSPPVVLRSDRFSAVLADYLHSSGRQLFAGRPHWSALGEAEDAVFLGAPLIVVLLIGVLGSWRGDRGVRIAAGAGGCFVALTLGRHQLFGVWSPWSALTHVPHFAAILPVRFAVATSFAIGWLLAHWVDRLSTVEDRSRVRTRALAGAVALSLVALATVVPRADDSSPLPRAPQWFGSRQERAQIPAGAPVLLLPMPWPGDASAMYIQQLDNFRFRIIGGYGLVPPARVHDADEVLRDFVNETSQRPHRRAASVHPTLAEARDALARLNPRAVVVVLSAPHAAALLEVARELTGRPADVTSGGASVWLQRTGASHRNVRA